MTPFVRISISVYLSYLSSVYEDPFDFNYNNHVIKHAEFE